MTSEERDRIAEAARAAPAQAQRGPAGSAALPPFPKASRRARKRGVAARAGIVAGLALAVAVGLAASAWGGVAAAGDLVMPDFQIEPGSGAPQGPSVALADRPPTWAGLFVLTAGPDRPFAPSFSLSESTTQAASNPDLTFEMHKEPNHCETPGVDDWRAVNTNYEYWYCAPKNAYIEQDLKKIVVRLPPGLLADANAAPYCDAYEKWEAVPGTSEELLRWYCRNLDAAVGRVEIAMAGCDPYKGDISPWVFCGASQGDHPPGILVVGAGTVYNERPADGEQGHLVVLWPEEKAGAAGLGGVMRVDIGIRVRDDMSLEAVADNIPDWYQGLLRDEEGNVHLGSATGGQIADMVMTLYGSTGEESGHPLIVNPTFCDEQMVDAELQGYEYNSIDNRVAGQELVFPEGEGKTVTAAPVPYRATGCDAVPYDPELQIALDSYGPDAAPAISSTVTQGYGEATTKRVRVTFPKAFKINASNTAEHCSEADLAAASCPDVSRIGTATVTSPLLPVGETLAGNVYLAGLTGDSVKLSALLHGFVDVRVDGEGTVGADGTTATFDNLPAVPVTELSLNLEGGGRSLLKTPKVCASQAVQAEFTSHSGKVASPLQSIEIQGCEDPTLGATLSTRKAGAPTDLELSVGSKGTRLSSVKFAIDRRLSWGVRKRLKAKKKKELSSAGTATFTTAQGELSTRLKAKRKGASGARLLPLASRSSGGTVVASAVPDLAASLYRSGKRAAKGGKSKARTSRLALAGLPQDDLTALTLSLKGTSKRRKLYLRNPASCRKLEFIAYVTTADGRSLTLTDRARIRGCGRKR